jgi:hypothetical protein
MQKNAEVKKCQMHFNETKLYSVKEYSEVTVKTKNAVNLWAVPLSLDFPARFFSLHASECACLLFMHAWCRRRQLSTCLRVNPDDRRGIDLSI